MRLVALAVVFSASSVSAQSEACRDHLREAYIALSTIPVQMSEAITDARVDGIKVPANTLAEPDRFAEETAEWGERLIELANMWCR